MAPPPHGTSAGASISTRAIISFALGVLALRVLATAVGTLIEGDEISIASGIAAIVRGVPGVTYRYGLQFGYYRAISLLVSISGGDVRHIPVVMSWLSLLAGVVIPVCGLMAFRRELSARERWMVAAILAANPIVWMSARYGNTAMPSAALTAAAFTILSNRPKRWGEVLALALFAAGITMRADAVLVSGGLLVILWRTHGSLMRATLRVGAVGVVIAAIMLALRAADPYMESVGRELSSHIENPITTRFFEYLLWAMSPFPLLFAAAGFRETSRERSALFLTLLAWIGPPFAFYFTNTTTPRYVLQGIFPLAIAAAIGMLAFVEGSAVRRRVAWGAILSLGFLHLFIGLSEFSPNDPRSIIKRAEIGSDDGKVWLGALLYKSYLQRPLHLGRLVQSRFQPSTSGELTFTAVFDSLASGSRRGARVVIANGGGYANTMHLFANLAGATPVNWTPGTVYDGECEFELGGARIGVVGLSLLRKTDRRIDLRAGDELWVVARDSSAGFDGLAGHLPDHLIINAQPAWGSAPRLVRYLVRERAS